ncbi:hypothetical protein AD006_22400 [Pseudonocardia sp. EC080610-09]|nr:hypothetical protein FRP1_14735 [Pseudonocardia sp. EC080625-04]ALL77366.1 hypothetical protein AD006_22400 [Pseudonocardia sp. EC080610-09]ALL80281.1 hypothetical protein AD017_01985 [Pseudonocardia sp. EC080619-01]
MRSDHPILPCRAAGERTPRPSRARRPPGAATGATGARADPAAPRAGTVADELQLPLEPDGPDVSPTRTPARRLAAVLLLSLVAVLAPVAGPATAWADPVPASVGSDAAPAAAGPQSALATRPVPGGPLPADDAAPPGPPGPALDALVLAPPQVTAAAVARPVAEKRATTGLDPGHASASTLRGPPAA